MVFKKKILVLILCLPIGCTTQGPIPPADLAQTGWQWFSGQAAWRPGAGKVEVTGDLLVGWTSPSEGALEFAKPPFVIATARQHALGWEMTFPAQGKHYSYPGLPPKDVIWFQLLNVLRGDSPGKKWAWQTNQNGWVLSAKSGGAVIEGFLAPQNTNQAPGESER